MIKAKHAAVLLSLCALLTTALVLTAQITNEARTQQVQLRAQQQLTALLPEPLRQQSIHWQVQNLSPNPLLQLTENVPMYVATINGSTMLQLIPVQQQGYVGVVKSVIAIDEQGVVQQVNIVKHQETLGFVSPQQDFSTAFLQQWVGATMNDKTETWALKKEGGHYDYITGATISSRTVMHSVAAALSYFNSTNTLQGAATNE